MTTKKTLRLHDVVYTLGADMTWSGKGRFVKQLNLGTELYRERSSPADGDPRTAVLHAMAKLTGGTIVDDEEPEHEDQPEGTVY